MTYAERKLPTRLHVSHAIIEAVEAEAERRGIRFDTSDPAKRRGRSAVLYLWDKDGDEKQEITIEPGQAQDYTGWGCTGSNQQEWSQVLVKAGYLHRTGQGMKEHTRRFGRLGGETVNFAGIVRVVFEFFEARKTSAKINVELDYRAGVNRKNRKEAAESVHRALGLRNPEGAAAYMTPIDLRIPVEESDVHGSVVVGSNGLARITVADLDADDVAAFLLFLRATAADR